MNYEQVYKCRHTKLVKASTKRTLNVVQVPYLLLNSDSPCQQKMHPRPKPHFRRSMSRDQHHVPCLLHQKDEVAVVHWKAGGLLPQQTLAVAPSVLRRVNASVFFLITAFLAFFEAILAGTVHVYS